MAHQHNQSVMMGPSPPTLDPRVLLNPKASQLNSHEFKSNSFNQDRQNKVTANSYDQNQNQDFEFGSVMEKLHNVEQRSERPTKRLKQRDEPEDIDQVEDTKKQKAQFSHGGSGGDISEYMKEQRKQGHKEAMTSGVVDLTAEDDETMANSEASADKDLVCTKDTHLEEVCLGRIDRATVNAHKIPTPKMLVPQAGSKYWPAMKVEVARRPGSNTSIIGVIDPTGKDFGTIDVRTASALAPLMDYWKQNKLRIQARLDVRPRKPYEAPQQNVSDNYPINLTLFARRYYAQGIGKQFSQRQVFLREPTYPIPRHIQYWNPHEKKSFKATEKPYYSLVASTSRYGHGSAGTVVRTTEEVRTEVLKIFDSIKNTDDLPEMEPCSDIKTKLLPHQKQALHFMTNREKDRSNDDEGKDETSLWQESVQNGRSSWYNVISGHEMRDKPMAVRGGILADVMGLGKTLNVLSTIMGSRSEAIAFGKLNPPKPKYEDDPQNLAFNSRGTLLICPLSTVSNWEDQIKSHIRNGKRNLDYVIYHGQNRTNDPIDLQDVELVITTYSVVSADTDKRSSKRPRSPLAEINWFRIVLDEAHTIREQQTRQSKAVCALSAERRWAVTGTPVQNRLEDLGALIKFLHIQPFDSPKNFAQFIISPFKTADTEILPKLRVLVDSITLRRNKDKLDLPGREEMLVELKMSSDEWGFYKFYSQQADKNVKSLLGDRAKLGGSAYAHILRAVLRLRLLCAHGADLLSDEDWEASRGFTANTAIDLEDENDEQPDRAPRQAYEMWNMLRDSGVNTCGVCQKAVQVKEFVEDADEDSDDDSDTFGFLTPCNHVICPSCIEGHKAELKKGAGPDNHTYCTICETYIQIKFFELKETQLKADQETQKAVRSNPRLARSMGRYSGPHTKTKTLLHYLAEDAKWSAEHPDERPIKSVIFSTWTNHLDLIQIALTEAKYPYVRLDGSMSRTNRKIALDSFSTSPNITCILVSITAGGLGLNLTAASRVYVMEPQYNPAAEAQAIERVHRLGQTRDVKIYKFIMKQSIEEKMLLVQKKKRDLANLSIEKTQQFDKAETAKRRLEELRSLFR